LIRLYAARYASAAAAFSMRPLLATLMPLRAGLRRLLMTPITDTPADIFAIFLR